MRSSQEMFLKPDGTVRSGWKVVLFVILNGSILSLLAPYLWRLGFSIGMPWEAQLWLGGIATLGVSWLFLALEKRSLSSIGLVLNRRWGMEFFVGTAIGFLLMACVALTVWGFGGFHWEKAAGNGLASLGSGAWLFLAVAFREEIHFRGYGFQRLAEGTWIWVALVIASIYFAFAHWNNPGMSGDTKIWASLNICLAGILLGLSYLKTRSLAMPMGLHLAWNWTQGSLMGFGVSGLETGSLLHPVLHDRPLWLTGGSFGLEASLPCAAFCTLSIVALAYWKPPER